METIGSLYTAINEGVAAVFAALGSAFVRMCEVVFKPVLSFFFDPINRALAPIYQPWATIVAFAFFLGAMVWVWVVLKESYVNLGRPNQAWYSDLRIWTVCSMLPHLFVYVYFY